MSYSSGGFGTNLPTPTRRWVRIGLVLRNDGVLRFTQKTSLKTKKMAT